MDMSQGYFELICVVLERPLLGYGLCVRMQIFIKWKLVYFLVLN